MNMKSVTKLFRSQTNVYKNMNVFVCRGKNDWESDRTRYNVVDEHEPPKQEEILREIFDRNYYHFLNKGKNADHHGTEDQFMKYRMWQHLYLAPEQAFLRNDRASPLIKFLYFIFPTAMILYFVKTVPAKNKRRLGRRYWRKHMELRQF